jgi:hypothetical protein
MYTWHKILVRSSEFNSCEQSGNSPAGYFPHQSLREKTHVGLHVKCPLLLSDFLAKIGMRQKILVEFPGIMFRESNFSHRI